MFFRSDMLREGPGHAGQNWPGTTPADEYCIAVEMSLSRWQPLQNTPHQLLLTLSMNLEKGLLATHHNAPVLVALSSVSTCN